MLATENIRRNLQKLLLVYDGFAGHIIFRTLDILCKNSVIIVGLPAHTSHALQPVDAQRLSNETACFVQ